MKALLRAFCLVCVSFVAIPVLVADDSATGTSADALLATGMPTASNPIGRVLVIKGSASVMDRENSQTRSLVRNGPVFERDIIQTADNSFVVIEFSDHSRITVRPASSMAIERFRDNDGEKISILNLLRGGLRVITGDLAKSDPDSFRLKTANASMGVRGTKFDARVCTDDCSEEEENLGSSDADSVDPECETPMQGLPAGLYATPYLHQIYVEKNGEIRDLKPGQSQYAGSDKMACLAKVPRFLAEDQTPFGDQIGDLAFGDCGSGLDASQADSIAGFVNEGYNPASVLLHASSMGMSVDQMLFWAVKADPNQAQNYYDSLLELMPNLPGYVCPGSARHASYTPTYHYFELDPQSGISDVIQRFFENEEQMAPFPDWTAGASHMRSPLVDLMSYRSEDYWYRSRVGGGGPGTSSRDVVFVSLYPQDQRVVHDLTDRIGKAASAPGSAPLRVVFIYNKPFQVPVSRFGEEVEIESLFESFYSDGTELTPVPRWEAGDYHVEVSFEDLEEQFNIPETGAIDPDRYAQLKSELQRHGFDRDPVKITLLRGGEGDRQGENGTRGNRWLDQADRIRVARDLGMDGFPTVMFYNSLNRQECGAVPACYERLCESAVCAGADPSVCSEPAIDRSGGRPNVVPIINPTTLVSPS